jgi:23S rRNA (adenine2503-C2)-methyltransferase
MKLIRKRKFANGLVYALETDDGYPIETTDTHLPYYTKDAIGQKQNKLKSADLGSRAERWMVGVSVMSGCPVGCKFCATASLPKWRSLTSEEIVRQVTHMVDWARCRPEDAKEFKINYTRMGEPFLNIDNVRRAIEQIEHLYPGTHHYVSTIGLTDSDFGWIKGDITLQVSLHSLDEDRRNALIPWSKKMSIEELGGIRTDSNLKTTINLTLCDWEDFDIDALKRCFDPEHFFVKLSPINPNAVSEANGMGIGPISDANLG